LTLRLVTSTIHLGYRSTWSPLGTIVPVAMPARGEAMIFLGLLGFYAIVFAAFTVWRRKLGEFPRSRRHVLAAGTVLALTAGYWVWESQAAGNIRVDLILIYPALFAGYIWVLWDSLKWLSILAASILMAGNYGFFVISYDLFNKSVG